jgi:plastocyanin
MSPKRLLVLLTALAAVGLLLIAAAGCGVGAFEMDEMHQRMHGPGDRAPQTPVRSADEAVTVEIRDYDFFPRDLTVGVGTEVTWANRDSVPHDATSGDEWGTGLLRENESASLSFSEPGSYDYICTVHPDMTGTLTVEVTS